MRKLLSLLKKDAILVRRSKIWTAFEVIIPVLILLFPLLLFEEKDLLQYKNVLATQQQRKNLTGQVFPVDLTDIVPDLELAVDGCDVPPDVDLRIYDKYVGNHTKPDRERFAEIVRSKAMICKPVGGVFVTSEGVEMIVPMVEENMKTLKENKRLEKDSTSAYMYYTPYLYKAMLMKFKKYYKALNFKPSKSPDQLKRIFIYDETEYAFSFFGTFSALISLSVTLPVINTARTMTVEKSSVQPYLASIGLSRSLFYAEHFIFSTLKSAVLIFFTIVFYCIFFSRFNAFWMLTGVLVYIMGSVSFAMLVSAFFKKPRRCVEGIVVIWSASITLIWFHFKPKGWETIPASLNINQAFRLYILAIEPYFVKDGGMSFSDGFTSDRPGQYSCFVYLLIMIFDTVIMCIGSVIASKIVDRVSGFIMNSFWRKVKHVEEPEQSSSSTTESVDVGGIILGEEVVKGRKNAVSDIELDHLIKIYGNGEMAVNGLSMRAIRGQVSILLGHNGCGKSTTFGMITGIVPPTSGTVTIAGVDAIENRREARQFIGYCPQYNPLYDKLTVMEHLRLVNSLKGASFENFEEEANSLLEKISLSDKKNVQAKKLSGGMKRKLSVCMAMIGGSKVVLLDEPTAGMDPGARFDVQKMLNDVKTDRSILLTTHYMDEAEKLGDYVFVMSHGKMAASGSLPFLKKKYGDGYLLTLVMDSADNTQQALPILQKLCAVSVENSSVKDSRGQMVELSLPENKKEQFLSFFKVIEAIIAKEFDSTVFQYLSAELLEQVKQLKIIAMGLSVSSLEQVFINIEKECDRVLFGIEDEEKRKIAEKNFMDLNEAKKENPVEGNELVALQFRTLLFKRLIYVLRNADQLLTQFVLPMLIMYFFLEWGAIDTHTDLTNFNKNLSLSEFPPSKVFLQFEGPPDRRISDYLEKYKHLEVFQVPMKTKVKNIVNNQTKADKKVGMIISVYKRRTIVHYHEINPSTLPIALNLLHNLKYIRLDSKTPVGNNSLHVQIIPVTGSESSTFDGVLSCWKFNLVSYLLALCVFPAIMFLVEEKVTKFQHQQMLTGISPLLFWFSTVFWDTILFIVPLVFTTILMAVFGFIRDYIYLEVATFTMFFFATLSLVYMFSIFLKVPTVGTTTLVFLRTVSFFFITVFFIFKVLMSGHPDEKLRTVRLMYLSGFIDAGYVQMCALSKLYFSQSRLESEFSSARIYLFDYDSIFEFIGIWMDLIALLLLIILFSSLFIFFRSRFFKRSLMGFKNAAPREKKRYAFMEESMSTNVESTPMVSSTVDTSTQNTQNGNVVIVVKDLVKDFGKLRAVNGLSLDVREKECFGLLGQNGAGKTTTFDMLTGVTVPSGGSATISGEEVNNRVQIGYCPQFDTLLGQFSGRQCLRIMAQLQGYPNCEEVVEMVLTCVGMSQHGDKTIQHCSGGQKRKISVGITLLSRSQCVMLDEPTAGIDPRARRDIWEILHNMREKAHSSIILTSHSMEECEALCTRIGVLRSGDMVAVGTSQELKSRFGSFYLLTMVLESLERVAPVKEAVTQKWKDAILKTEPTNASLNIVYQLPKSKNSKWSDMFHDVEELASELEVEDFMLTQATLEDAFIRLISD